MSAGAFDSWVSVPHLASHLLFRMKPIRKSYYNLTVTLLSVLVAVVVEGHRDNGADCPPVAISGAQGTHTL